MDFGFLHLRYFGVFAFNVLVIFNFLPYISINVVGKNDLSVGSRKQCIGRNYIFISLRLVPYAWMDLVFFQ